MLASSVQRYRTDETELTSSDNAQVIELRTANAGAADPSSRNSDTEPETGKLEFEREQKSAATGLLETGAVVEVSLSAPSLVNRQYDFPKIDRAASGC